MKLADIKQATPIREHGDIASLKASIAALGLINPLTVDTDGNLLAGRRRYQAIRELGWAEVAVTVVPTNGDELTALRVAIDENLKRKPLTDPENRALIAQYDELGREREGSARRGERTDLTSLQCNEVWTQQKTATNLGISQPSVSQAIEAEEIVKAHPELAHLKTKQILRKAKIMSQQEQLKALEAEGLPSGEYDVILADPPWRYDFSETDSRNIENQYPTMDLEQIKALNVPSAENAVLLLWATAPKLEEALTVMRSWGFTYRTNAVWNKEVIGMGYWFRSQHEHLLVGVKGTFSPPSSEARFSSVIRQRRGKHSSKPNLVYDIVESMFPHRRYLELFARKHRAGWKAWGNEI